MEWTTFLIKKKKKLADDICKYLILSTKKSFTLWSLLIVVHHNKIRDDSNFIFILQMPESPNLLIMTLGLSYPYNVCDSCEAN